MDEEKKEALPRDSRIQNQIDQRRGTLRILRRDSVGNAINGDEKKKGTRKGNALIS